MPMNDHAKARQWVREFLSQYFSPGSITEFEEADFTVFKQHGGSADGASLYVRKEVWETRDLTQGSIHNWLLQRDVHNQLLRGTRVVFPRANDLRPSRAAMHASRRGWARGLNPGPAD